MLKSKILINHKSIEFRLIFPILYFNPAAVLNFWSKSEPANRYIITKLKTPRKHMIQYHYSIKKSEIGHCLYFQHGFCQQFYMFKMCVFYYTLFFFSLASQRVGAIQVGFLFVFFSFPVPKVMQMSESHGKWGSHMVGCSTQQQQPQTTANDRNQPQSTANNCKQPQTTVNNRKEPQTTANNSKQPQTTANNHKQPQTTANNRKQPQTTTNNNKQQQTTEWRTLFDYMY